LRAQSHKSKYEGFVLIVNELRREARRNENAKAVNEDTKVEIAKRIHDRVTEYGEIHGA
jgi:hypothetical protein